MLLRSRQRRRKGDSSSRERSTSRRSTSRRRTVSKEGKDDQQYEEGSASVTDESVSPASAHHTRRRTFSSVATASKLPALPVIVARVYKRWIAVSVVLTLVFAWFVFPLIIDRQMMPAKLSQLSEFLFETSLLKLMPAGGIFSGDDFLGNITSILQPFWKSEYDDLSSPGRLLRAKGVRGKYPVLMIPGITSTGLELWEGQACAQSFFRQRLWGTLTMMRFMIMDGACWMQHLKLNSSTGGDPEGIKLRPAQGLEAADFILPGFWVWARIIENLAEIGYDHNNLQMAAYDWRLDIVQLERRDHYFSRLKAQIELLVKTRGQKVVILSHSLGGIIWLYFQKWVESNVVTEQVQGGGGGPTWIDRHVHAVASIGAPYLGLPKAVCMTISGEMRDTAQMGKFETFLLDMLMNKKERLGLFRTWLGGYAMLPKGGNLIWGSTQGNVVDAPSGVAYGVIHFNETTSSRGLREAEEVNEEEARKSPSRKRATPPSSLKKDTYTVDDLKEILEAFLPPPAYERVKQAYAWEGIAKNAQEVAANEANPATWTNPLLSALPRAPNLKIYCLYGVGKDTERGYEYEAVPLEQWSDLHAQMAAADNLTALHESQRSDEIKEVLLRYKLDLEKANSSHRLYTGIYHVDGDGTVPTLSNGYMCAHGWRHYRHLNPANVTVVAREYLHEPSAGLVDLRGGPRTSEHVDILGNHEMTMDILKIVSDHYDDDDGHHHGHQDEHTRLDSVPQDRPRPDGDTPVPERVLSTIREMAAKIKMPF